MGKMANGSSLACATLIAKFWLVFSLLAPACAQNRTDEVNALKDFVSQDNFRATNGVYWSTWNFSEENACGWVGISCTNSSNVAEINLRGWGIGGYLYDFGSLSRLRDLQRLDLSSNGLSAHSGLPQSIGQLTGLRELDLSNNAFGGSQIDSSISGCRQLRFLSLSQNSFIGGVPAGFGNLTRLQVLLLADSGLYGEFPTELTELSNLVSLDLSNNNFTGSIPAIPKLTNLASLKLDNNSFTGFQRFWFSTLSQSVQVLSAPFNQLRGNLPSSITLRDIRLLNLTANLLTGHVPSVFRQVRNSSDRWSDIFDLDLSHNQLQGEIPVQLLRRNGTCDSINLSHNSLNGRVPSPGAFQFPRDCYVLFDVSHNNLSGAFPLAVVSSMDASGHLRIGNNQFTGNVTEILSRSNVVELRLENNLLTGDLSTFASNNESDLSVLDLSNNQIQWTASEGNRDPIATTLSLAWFNFVKVFHVGGNNFSGTPLPSTCPYFIPGDLDFSNTHVKGEISSAVFNSSCISGIGYLNLSGNELSGPVPDTIILLPGLASLDLSNNQLSGQLPLSLSTSTTLNIPSFFKGNIGLCGYPLASCPQAQPARGLKWWVILIVIAGSIVIAMGSCLVATWKWRTYQRKHRQDADLIKTLLEREASIMPLRDVKKATDNFAPSAKIGEGGFGTVYVGKLNNGIMVAIKRSKREGSVQDKEQFLNEVRILSHVKHRNLVKLLGCCMENKVAVLVFEYIPNGTLQEHLSGELEADSLSWRQRLNIAVQTADALNYLHTAAAFPIYHRDMKSANIMLDSNFDAKVGDFGISKLAPLAATHVSTIAVQGTIGYIDPEYYTSYKLTDKSDVYSFGVVLLELISAKPALDFQRGGENTGLVFFASLYIEDGELDGFIDPALLETYNDMGGNGRENILALGKLAFRCLNMQAKARPSMNEVLKGLQELRAAFEGKLEKLEDSQDKELEHDRRAIFTDLLSDESSLLSIPIDSGSLQMSQYPGTGVSSLASVR